MVRDKSEGRSLIGRSSFSFFGLVVPLALAAAFGVRGMALADAVFDTANELWVNGQTIATAAHRSLPIGRKGCFLSTFGAGIWGQDEIPAGLSLMLLNGDISGISETSAKGRSPGAGERTIEIGDYGKIDPADISSWGATIGRTWVRNRGNASRTFLLAFGAARSHCNGTKVSVPETGQIGDDAEMRINSRQKAKLFSFIWSKTWISDKAMRRSLSLDLINQWGSMALRAEQPNQNFAFLSLSDSNSETSLSFGLTQLSVSLGVDLFNLGGFRFGPYCQLMSDGFDSHLAGPPLHAVVKQDRSSLVPGLQWLWGSSQRISIAGHAGYRVYADTKTHFDSDPVYAFGLSDFSSSDGRGINRFPGEGMFTRGAKNKNKQKEGSGDSELRAEQLFSSREKSSKKPSGVAEIALSITGKLTGGWDWDGFLGGTVGPSYRMLNGGLTFLHRF
ncbi:MAG: hypothetical protein LBB14_01405 [Puniceicoccales bacterium]|nr:hypothetical protein [Puniceicoccales bacterium]